MSQTPTDTLLAAQAFREDPRVAEAKKLILEALADHARDLTEVRPGDEQAKDSYSQWLERLAKMRGNPPFWPYLSSGLGNGPYVELSDGSVKLDFIGGIGVHGTGHSHPAMVSAGIDAALEDTVMQGNLQQNPASVQMMEKLVAMATETGAGLDHCMLSTSGAMANENALKIAFHNAHPASRIIAFDNAFAGRSLAMASLTDRPKYRAGLPLTIDVDYIPFRDPSNPARSQRWAVDEVRRLLDRHPGKYAAFWAEPIAGEGGYYGGSGEFFRALCEPLKEAGVLIIFDEVQSFSRTSRPFAFQHYGLDEFADIVTVGKITQVCATLYASRLKPNAPILSQTFTGSTSSILTGIEMLKLLEDEGCFGEGGQNMQRARYFAERLAQLGEKYPGKVSGPFGEGMMVGFTPGDGSLDFAKQLMTRLYEIGLLGFVCGGNPTRLRFLPPPVNTTNEHIDQAIALIDAALAEL